MNTKRQTVWLVSMLSIMVVLSAYYLFTEDVRKLDSVADTSAVNQITTDTRQSSTSAEKAAQAGQDAAKTDASKTDASKTDASKTDASKTDASKTDASKTDASKTHADQSGKAADAAQQADGKTKTDAKVLEELSAAKSGGDFLAMLEMGRNDSWSKDVERLLGIINDPSQSTEAIGKAQDDLSQLEQKEAKVTSIEEELTKEFSNAALTEENGRWKVLVQDTKLEKSQAVGIVDLVMKELNVGPEKVQVQVVH